MVRNSAGWPASEGTFSILELPVSPWQPLHTCRRSWSVSAAAVPVHAAVQTAAPVASARARDRRIFLRGTIAPGYLPLAVLALP